MGFALVLIGLILVVTGYKDTYQQLGSQLVSDFTGQKNFIYWILALGAVGAAGYIRELRDFSHWFMALIIISMVLSNQGFFQKFMQQIQAGPKAPAQTSAATQPATSAATTQAATTFAVQAASAAIEAGAF